MVFLKVTLAMCVLAVRSSQACSGQLWFCLRCNATTERTPNLRLSCWCATGRDTDSPWRVCRLKRKPARTGGESIDVEMKVDLALDTRDALAKSIYAAVFKCGIWLHAVAARHVVCVLL